MYSLVLVKMNCSKILVLMKPYGSMYINKSSKIEWCLAEICICEFQEQWSKKKAASGTFV